MWLTIRVVKNDNTIITERNYLYENEQEALEKLANKNYMFLSWLMLESVKEIEIIKD